MVENAKIQNWNATFEVIFKHCAFCISFIFALTWMTLTYKVNKVDKFGNTIDFLLTLRWRWWCHWQKEPTPFLSSNERVNKSRILTNCNTKCLDWHFFLCWPLFLVGVFDFSSKQSQFVRLKIQEIFFTWIRNWFWRENSNLMFHSYFAHLHIVWKIL